MSELVTLKIGSQRYEGWKSFSVSNSIESIAGGFSLSVTDNWGAERGLAWPIKPGDAAELFFGSDQVLTGFVDEVETRVDAAIREITVTGRSKTCDLVDCSADVQGSSFYNIKLEELAKKLCAPFGISVTAKVSTGAPLRAVNINIGESVFEVLEKRARQKGVLLIATQSGNIEIIRPSTTFTGTGLEEGKNLKAIRSLFSMKDRFSRYKVKSQASVDEGGLEMFAIEGTSTDSNVKRHRPLLISAEVQADAGAAQNRARYEAIVRAARGAKFSVTVQGFRQNIKGALWQPNQLVRVHAPIAGIEEELLISAVTYQLDDSNGSETVLELVRKDAFTPEPQPDPAQDPTNALGVLDA